MALSGFRRLFNPDTKKMERRNDIRGLIRALDHVDWDVRMEAAEALGNIGDKRAAEALIDRLLYDNDPNVRVISAISLSKLKDPASIEPLIKCLDMDGNGLVSTHCARVLGELGDKKAIEPLLKYYKSTEDLAKKEAASYALKRLGYAESLN